MFFSPRRIGECAVTRKRLWRMLAAAGIALIVCGPGADPAAGQVVPADQLRIVVLQGEGDSHRQGDKKPTSIKVQVLNEIDLPQSEAEVTFQTPKDGPSVFLDTDKKSVTVKSDLQGYVTVEGVIGNDLKGVVSIAVSASFEGKTGAKTVNQVIQGRFWTRNKKIIGAAGVGATAAILWGFLRPGPPTAGISGATATVTAPPSAHIALPRNRKPR